MCPGLNCASKVHHHSSSPRESALLCCTLVWKGRKGHQEQGSALSEEAQAQPQCCPCGHGWPGKSRTEFPCTTASCKHLDTHVHTQTHAHTQKT